ncbi:MAG: DUF3798 domain-containing protein [Clostridiaceae bacterium]|nr:DUF3798 domain-containing protein [Clostridiaceae bacterium]
MLKKIMVFMLVTMMIFSLTACQSATTSNEGGEVVDAASSAGYKIGIVTPTLSTSEDEFRAAAIMADKYPDIVRHITLPENFNIELETGISQILSLADDPEMKAIIVNSGQAGLLPAFQSIREKRPDILTIATMMDEPDLMSNYIDMNFSTDWLRRGVTIPTKAKEMGATTFIHYSFPTHLARDLVANRRDVMKQTVEELGMEFVEVITPDPQTGDGTAPMLQFLREDIPRQIAKYGPDTNIFGSNCPMYDVMLDEAFKLKFLVAEQCCPTPTQAYPTVLGLEIGPEDIGNFDLINDMITEKAKEAEMTGRLSGWAMPSSVYIPQFEVELAKYIIEEEIDYRDVLNKAFLDDFSEEVMGIRGDFEPMGEYDNYFMLVLDSIFY